METGKEINEYLRRMKNGEGGLTELFNAVSGHVKFVAFKYLADKSLVNDVVTNTFKKLIKSIGSFDEQQSGKAWICKIAQNEAFTLNEAEKRHAHESLDDLPDGVACTSDPTDSLLFDWDLDNALSELDERDRQIVELRIFADMTFTQIAKRLDMHAGSVYKRFKIALKQIKEKIF